MGLQLRDGADGGPCDWIEGIEKRDCMSLRLECMLK